MKIIQKDWYEVKNLPVFYQVMIFLLITALFSVLIGFLVMVVALKIAPIEPWVVFLSYTLTFGWVYLLSKKLWGVETLANSRVPLRVYLFIIPMVILLAVPLEGMVNLIPMPESIRLKFEQMITLNLQGFLTIAIAAPLLEEFIFRGVLLKSLLNNYTPKKAIIWSAILFGIAHMNPWQFIPAFLIGLLIGWIYWKTQSIWPGILIHFINNTFSFTIGYVTNDINTSFYELFGGPLAYTILIIVSILVSFGLIFWLKKYLDHLPSKNNYVNETLITN